MNKKWYIGIDFGTINTYIVAYEATECKAYTNSTKNGFEKLIFDSINENEKNIIKKLSRLFKKTKTTTKEISKNTKNEDDTSSDVIELVLTDNDKNIPTVVTEITKGGHCLVGQGAVELQVLRLFKDLKTVARQLTPDNASFDSRPCEYPFENCGLDTVLQFGTDDYPIKETACEAIIKFFRTVLHIDMNDALQIDKDTVQKIVIGCPAEKSLKDGTRANYEDTLKNILAEAFIKRSQSEDENNKFKEKIEVIAEPELAGTTYLYKEKERENKTVLVIDIGGGTTDFSVLEYDNKEDVKAQNIGSCNFAGETIDASICNYLNNNLFQNKKYIYKAQYKRIKERMFADYEFQGGAALYRIKPKEDPQKMYCELADILLDEDHRKICYAQPILQDGTDFYVIGKELDKVFYSIESELDKALDKYKSAALINTVFFVGGTSVIKPLRDKLLKVVKDKVNKENKPILSPTFDASKDVITMFDNFKDINLDGRGLIPLTFYNAVAIGACIKARGAHVIVTPKVSYSVHSARTYTEEVQQEILLTSKQTSFFAKFFTSNIIDAYQTRYRSNDDVKWQFAIDKKEIYFEIPEVKDFERGHGLLFRFELIKNKCLCKAYKLKDTEGVAIFNDKGNALSQATDLVKKLNPIFKEKIDISEEVK